MQSRAPPTAEELLERALPDGPEKWAKKLDYLLESSQGLPLFRTYLTKTFCEENLQFWVEIQDLRTIREDQVGHSSFFASFLMSS
jgi:hypothetical protein